MDLNGAVTLRAQSVGQPVTELGLSRSQCSGAALRINTNRNLLARAMQLGFREVQLHDANSRKLIAALRKRNKRTRIVENTLASLRHLHEVA